MSARITYGIPPPRHALALTMAEIDRAIGEERSFHRLIYKKRCPTAMCSCGWMLRDVSSGPDANSRHNMHVHECVRVLEDRLNGVER